MLLALLSAYLSRKRQRRIVSLVATGTPSTMATRKHAPATSPDARVRCKTVNHEVYRRLHTTIYLLNLKHLLVRSQRFGKAPSPVRCWHVHARGWCQTAAPSGLHDSGGYNPNKLARTHQLIGCCKRQRANRNGPPSARQPRQPTDKQVVDRRTHQGRWIAEGTRCKLARMLPKYPQADPILGSSPSPKRSTGSWSQSRQSNSHRRI